VKNDARPDRQRSFFDLTPVHILAAVETSGLVCTGTCHALNSYENRVYEVEVEETSGDIGRRIVKFYRPGRWSEAAILEEHNFLLELAAEELAVAAPEPLADGQTLQRNKATGIPFAIFPRIVGRARDELDDNALRPLAHLLARIHNVGRSRSFQHRPNFDVETMGRQSLRAILDSDTLPDNLRLGYEAIVTQILDAIEPRFAAARVQRLHGDAHLGNLLWRGDEPTFIDFDDMGTGPIVQDLWMSVPGRDDESRRRFDVLINSYDILGLLDHDSLRLIEPLRTLRMIRYSAWLLSHRDDPAFSRAFPAFGTEQYWAQQIQDLREQSEVLGLYG
jgi:Ser/Thr protein kinase RdoA (MazF antagonist)